MKIHEYNETMAYLMRPASLEEKLKEIDEKYPGSVKPANELPPVQDPFKDFEDRNPRETAAEGGVIGEDGMFKGEDMGTREGFADTYPGQSLESNLKKIKNLFLKGKTQYEIGQAIKKPHQTVAKAILSMRNNKNSPVKISQTEFNKRPSVKNTINAAYDSLKKLLKRKPSLAEVQAESGSDLLTVKNNIDSNKTFSTGRTAENTKIGTTASVKMFKAKKVDKPTRTTYDGVKGAKFKDAAQEKRYKSFLEKAATYPKGSPDNPYNKKFFAKEFNMPETDVESIHKIVREKYEITYPEPTDTSAGRRSKQLTKTSLPALEQEYSILKKDTSNLFNPDLAHRQSKTFNVTTSTLGLDPPVVNRYIVKPNETRISTIYGNRTKLIKKYLKKNGTYRTASLEDQKILKEQNNELKKLIDQTKGRLSGKLVNVKNLNTPYKDYGIDFNKSIGGQIVKNVPLQEVRNLSLEKQNFLKENLLKLKEIELKQTPETIAKEFEELLSDEKVRNRIQVSIDKGKSPKPVIKQMKEILKVAGIKSTDEAQTIINKIDKAPLPNKIKKPLIAAVYAGGVITGADFLKKEGIGFDKEFEQTASAGETPLVEKGLSTGEQTAIGAGALGTYAARKPILKTLGAIARPFGFPTVGGGFALSEILSDDPNYSIAGLDLLLPEIAKKTTVASRFLNPFGVGRYMTPVGTALITGDTLAKRAKQMMETSDKISDMEAGNEQNTLLEDYAAKDYRGYDKGGIVSLRRYK